MCYTVKQLIEKALKRAKHYGVKEDIIRYEDELKSFKNQFAASGFTHPNLIIYTNTNPYQPVMAKWGLIPQWIRTENEAFNIWNKTLNSRGETINEKPSFRDAFKSKRCLIPLDGFYEYHHQNNKTYPFFISRTDHQPLMIAGLWSEWLNQVTGELVTSCSIVTTRANSLMAKIHNNPKLKEPRMPVILTLEMENQWLDCKDKIDLQQFLAPHSDKHLKAHTVKKLKGKSSPGNTPEASDLFQYNELRLKA